MGSKNIIGIANKLDIKQNKNIKSPTIPYLHYRQLFLSQMSFLLRILRVFIFQ